MTETSRTGSGGIATRPGLLSFALARATIVIGGFTAVNLGVGLVRAKYSAAILGPGGVGLLSQANSFFLLGAMVCALGFAKGIIKQVASARAEGATGAGLATVATAFTGQVAATTVFVVASVAAIGPLYGLLFPQPGLELPFLLVVLALPFTVVASGVLDPVFFATNRYDLYTKASVAGALLGLVPFLAMTYVWGVRGAFASIFVTAVLRFASFLYYAPQVCRPRALFRLSLEWPILRRLFDYGAATLVIAAFAGAVQIMIRSSIIHTLGEHENGLYQVPVAFSSYYAPFLTNAFWGHLYPFVSAHTEEAADELGRALRMTIFTVTTLIVGLLLVQEWVVRLVFSRDFLPATAFMPIQLLGDVFYFPAVALGVFFLGLRWLRTYVVAAVAFAAMQGVFTLVLLPPFGLEGVAWAYTASAAGFLLVSVVLYRRLSDDWRPGLGPLIATATLVVAAEVAAIRLDVEWWWRLVPIGVWLGVLARRPEAAELLGALRARRG